MLIKVEAPLDFWEGVANTFFYTMNRSYKLAIGMTPYEVWWKVKLETRHLRVWFSNVTVTIPKEKGVDKLLPRGFKGILIGYPGSYPIEIEEESHVTFSN